MWKYMVFVKGFYILVDDSDCPPQSDSWTSKFEEVERELTSPKDTKRIEALESGVATSEQHGDIGKQSIPESQI